MKEIKEFPTAKVLSAITGTLVCEIGGVYEVLNWMTGESLFTHQLPRVGREARTACVLYRPELQTACDDAKEINRNNWQSWLETWTARYGETIAIPRLGIKEHEPIDAMSELAERAHPDRIIKIEI